jgi:hypothetical protein
MTGQGEARGDSSSKPILKATTLNELNHNHYDRNNQEHVNEPAQRVRRDQTQNPQNEQNDCNGVEHVLFPSADI